MYGCDVVILVGRHNGFRAVTFGLVGRFPLLVTVLELFCRKIDKGGSLKLFVHLLYYCCIMLCYYRFSVFCTDCQQKILQILELKLRLCYVTGKRNLPYLS